VADPAKPLLWHIRISHFNEKARWALDYKGVEYERRAPAPGAHMLFALWLTRGEHKTFPVLQLDGERIGDSTRIIEALERRYPEPPLYPDDAVERRRALEIEDFFDEEVAPHVRLLGWHEAIKDREGFDEFAAEEAPGPLGRMPRVAGAAASTFVRLRYGVASDAAAETARDQIVAGLDRLEAELGEGDYMVGDGFTVADLTAAALLYPLAAPPEGPTLPELPEPYRRFREPLTKRRGVEWVGEMFRRHRRPTRVTASA
jgi:glutathione S-transferase